MLPKGAGSPFLLYAYLPYKNTDGTRIRNRNWSLPVAGGNFNMIFLWAGSRQSSIILHYQDQMVFTGIKGNNRGRYAAYRMRIMLRRLIQRQLQLLVTNKSGTTKQFVVKTTAAGRKILLKQWLQMPM